MSRRRDNLVMIAVVAVIALIAAWVYFPGSTTEAVTAGDASVVSSFGSADNDLLETGDTDTAREVLDEVRFSDGPWIDWEDLPPEAVDTLLLIDSDGPYPYSKDGSTFQNREGFLPDHDRGYYREFTVETPGSRDRGARRIVGGAAGDLWYTADHYESFTEIVGW